LDIIDLSALLLVSKADIFLLPCPFKYLTGLDCPGCGFQRSAWALFTGHFMQSFWLYPPTIPFLLSFVAGVATWWFDLNRYEKWLKAMYFFAGFVMVVNYIYKIIFHHLH
jgi:Protein of unknown function (DUF2752)